VKLLNYYICCSANWRCWTRLSCVGRKNFWNA